MSERFFQAEIRAPDAATAERWLAEAFAAGAAGCEECAGDGAGRAFILYLSAAARPAVVAALRDAGAPPLAAAPVPERDWSEAWRDGLSAIEISPRLVVRPPSVPGRDVPGRACVVIEPGQAFGTGAHESTRLALELERAQHLTCVRGGTACATGFARRNDRRPFETSVADAFAHEICHL